MNEFENLQLLQGAVANMIEQREVLVAELTTLVTLLFGYVVASYLAGPSLKRVHIIVGTGLYLGAMVIFQLAFTGNLLLYAEIINRVMWHRAEANLPAPLGQWFTDKADLMITLTVASTAALTVGSIYFMWSVRRTKAE